MVPAWVRVGLAALLLVAFAAPPAASAHQEVPEGVQILVVLDVSGSMGDYVFSEDLPVEIQQVREQIADIEAQRDEIDASAEVVALRDHLDQLSQDSDLAAATEAFDTVSADLDAWLAGSGFEGLFETTTALRERLSELGCNEFLFASIVSSATPEDADGWIDMACGAALDEADRPSIHALVPFLADPDYQELNQDQQAAYAAVEVRRDELGLPALEVDLYQMLDGVGYYDLDDQLTDLENDLDDLATNGGFPRKLELAQMAVHTLLDLSRLDQASGGMETSLGLAIFSTEAELRHEMTTDLDAVGDEIDDLLPLDQTNIGAGMTVALDELERLRDPSRPAAIILLSDGHSNEGMPIAEILQTIPRLADDLDAIVCSAGFATAEEEVDVDLLRGLAEETDGEYLFVTHGEQLTSFFVACRQSLVGSVVERTIGTATAVPVEAGRITVPGDSCELNAVVSYSEAAPEVRLVDPSGAEAAPSVGRSDNVLLLTVADPASGVWVAEASSTTGDLLFSLVLSTEACAEAPAATVTTVAPPPVEDGGGSSAGLIIALVVVVLAGAGAAVLLVLRTRSKQGPENAPV